MRTLIIQHTEEENPGTLVDWTHSRGHATTIHHIYKNMALPKANEYDWLIILGGPMNVDEESKHPWLKEEKKIIEQFLKTGKPFLGICLGGQLLAQVLGAKITKNAHEEIGWHEVIRNANIHPAFHWPEKSYVFQWHEDRFDLPSGATPLATSIATEYQAFAYEKTAIGLQFHPESTKDWIFTSYAELEESKSEKNLYVQNFSTVKENTEKYISSMTENFFSFLDNMKRNVKK